jgi:hypothetical protein
MNKDHDKDDKIDVEDLFKDYLISNTDGLSKYLKAIWKVIHICNF